MIDQLQLSASQPPAGQGGGSQLIDRAQQLFCREHTAHLFPCSQMVVRLFTQDR
jgi:hypothetical protein